MATRVVRIKPLVRVTVTTTIRHKEPIAGQTPTPTKEAHHGSHCQPFCIDRTFRQQRRRRALAEQNNHRTGRIWHQQRSHREPVGIHWSVRNSAAGGRQSERHHQPASLEVAGAR